MTLVKFNRPASRTASPFNSLVNELFDNVNFPDFKKYNRGNFPSVNVSENEKEFQVEVSAAGFSKEEIAIAVEENTLTLSGEKKTEEAKEEKRYSRKEFSFANFNRSFTLPENIDQEKIAAKFENGIISITLPKKDAPEKVVRKIDFQ